MTTKELIHLCRTTALKMGVDQDLAVAICGQESNYVSSVVRYEQNWKYLFEVEKYSKMLGITLQSELQLQKFSWGPMQVMGSVARELGYSDHLPELIVPEMGLFYGCTKLQALSQKYKDQSDVIASYNGGNAIKVNGNYANRKYVEEVKKRIALLKVVQ